MKLHLLSILFTFFLLSCADDYKQPLDITTSDHQLVDLGQVKFDVDFSMSRVGNKTRLEFKTKIIKKGDHIDYITFYKDGKRLRANVVSTPNDFDCVDASCFTAHKISFCIDTVLPQTTYLLELLVNNGLDQYYSFHHQFKY